MYQHVLEEVETLPPDLFSVRLAVTQYEEIMTHGTALGYRVVVNHESSLGISHSIRLALLELGEEKMDYCFAVCDQPFLKAGTILGLAEGFKRSKKGLACLCSGKELGNPAVFSYVYRQELMELEGDTGGKKIIKRHMEDVYLHQVADERELVDVDVRR